MMNMTNVEIMANPALLTAEASEMSKGLIRLGEEMEEIERLIKATENYWKGEASDTCRNLYFSQKETVERVISRLREHPIDLMEIAKNYAESDYQLDRETEALPSDVIE